MKKIFKDFIHEEKGQGMVEYIFLIVLGIIACYLAYKGLGKMISSKTTDATNKLESGDS